MIDNLVNHLEEMHSKCRNFIESNDFLGLNNYMSEFNKDSSKINELKTILVHTKAFKEHEVIKDTRQKILDLFEFKITKGLS